MKTRVAFVLYRTWALEIFKEIKLFQIERPTFEIVCAVTIGTPDFDLKELQKLCKKVYIVDGKDSDTLYQILKKNEIDIAFCYSWSWILKGDVLRDFICLALHPSPLPKYRGGTPIQHQIMAGRIRSAVSVFKISEGIDDGPIYKQVPISFEGDIQVIFRRMAIEGIVITKQLLADVDNKSLKFIPQKKLGEYPALKRRTPSMSIVDLDTVRSWTFNKLHNLVRGLTFPYPSATLSLSGAKVLVHSVQYYRIMPAKSILLDNNFSKAMKNRRVFAKLKSGFAELTNYTLIKS